MSRGINKFIGIGNLGKDPSTKYMPSGDCVCNFSIAINESWTSKSGEKVEHSEWVNVVLYRKLAEIAGQYLKKGSQVYIEGKLKTRKYQDKQGNDRYITEIEAREMQMLGGKQVGAKASRQSESSDTDTGYDDDLPF